MCGIVGFSGSFSNSLLAGAAKSIAHRGPDGHGTWSDNRSAIGLAHRRLSIIDLSPTGAQPMESDDGAIALVFNGEIYNFRELRAELEAKGHCFRGNSDTEVLMRLYLDQGQAMLTMMNGIFAFALWDKRNQALFVARDALGVKPLYYTETTAGFAFASELKALLVLVPAARELDIGALHRYLSFLWCPGEGTPLRDVRKLLPGEALTVSAGRIARRWTWYQLPNSHGKESDAPVADVALGVAGKLRRAVHRQLVADVPVGAFLSGGLDSSAVVAFAKECVPNLRCFTIQPEGGQEQGIADDLPYARRVARHLDVSLDVVSIDSRQMAFDIENMVAQLDEPLADPSPLNVLYISRLARECGIKVLLSGAGGDDLFTGYRRHTAVQYEKYWQWLPAGLRAELHQGTSNLDQRNPLFRRLAKLFDGADLSGDARLVNYFVWAKESALLELYSPATRAGLGHDLANAPMVAYLGTLPSSIPPLERMLMLEQRFFLPDHNLNYTDKMSMAAGVEARVPFLDLELVEYAARIPMGLKQRGRVGKWILKKAMEPYLPIDVIYRPKSGFGAPLRRWMRHELRGLLGDMLSAESLSKRGLFEPAAVQNLINKNDSGRVDAAYTLLSLLSIEIWCRAYLDAVPVSDPA